MEIKRLLTNLCSKDLAASKKFYTSLFAFNVDYDSDWFVHLISEGRQLELGIIAESHEIVPDGAQGNIAGTYLTFVVEDVDAFHQRALAMGLKIQQAPEVTFYGQKRMILIAPEGTVCDISSPV